MQTAVEWLYHQIVIKNSDCLKWREYLEQAKEMEKQQIIDAYTDGESQQGYEDEAIQYYNETFKK